MIIPEKYLKLIPSELVAQGEQLFKNGKFLKFKFHNNFITTSFIDKNKILHVEVQIKQKSLLSKCSCGLSGRTLCIHGIATVMHYYHKKQEGSLEFESVSLLKSSEKVTQLIKKPTSSVNLTISTESTPQYNLDWLIVVKVKMNTKSYNFKKLVDAFYGKETSSINISAEDFLWQDREIIDFLVKNCVISSLITVPKHLVNSFLLLLTNHSYLFIKKETFFISHKRPKLFININDEKQKHYVELGWGVDYKQNLDSYLITANGVWLELERHYYYYPFFYNRALIMNFLKKQKFYFSQNEFSHFYENIMLLSDDISFDFKKLEIKDCKPVLQLNWTGVQLESYLSFDYENRYFSSDEKYFKLKNSYIRRFSEKEQLAKKQLINLGFQHKDSNFYVVENLRLISEFLQNHYENLCTDWQIYTNLNFYKKLLPIKSVSLEIKNIKTSSIWLEFNLTVTIDGKEYKSWQKKLFNQRSDNNYLILDGELIYIDSKVDNLLRDLKDYVQDNHCKVFKYIFIPLFNGLISHTKEVTKLKNIYDSFFNVDFKKITKVPTELSKKLRLYQREGVAWLQAMYKKRLSCILADEMGLGKTIQSLAFLVSRKKTFKTLVISPKSLVYNWKQECERFTPQLKVVVLDSQKDTKNKASEIKDANLVIISYRLLSSNINYYSKLKLDCLILDEAQYVKNYNSLTARCCRRLKVDFKLLLTGTPIENSIFDIWTLFDFMLPGILGKYALFKKKFENNNKEVIDSLSKIIVPFILRRYKKDVLKQLPKKQEQVMICQLGSEQKKLYDQYFQEMYNSHTFQENKIQIFAVLLKLKQICCDPRLVFPDTKIESAKFEMFKDIVTELQDSSHRSLVFSQFTSMLEILRQWLDEQNISYLYLDGYVKNRQKLIEEFNQNKKYTFFLISLKAGGVGLNLTGADTVIHYDLWWNPTVEDQATDRVHRIGQKKKVNVIKLVTKDTIEEKIITIQSKKRQLYYSMLENPDKISGLNKEDFEFLFS